MTRLAALIAQLGEQSPRESTDPSRREAAVAVLLTPFPDRILLIRRAERAGDPWSGDIALPGGKRDPGDSDLLATAIRETAEETGIALPREWCRAQLDDLVPTTPSLPPVRVRPFVFLLPTAQIAGVSSEVTLVAWTALAALAAEGVYRPAPVTVRGAERLVPGYRLPEGFLWGMTERILTPVLQQWMVLPG